MGRLNMDVFNFLSKEELRVLAGIELGMRNHELVPVSLIKYISGLTTSQSGLNKILRDLSDKRLIAREQAGKDFGYKLLVSGYDFLALKALVKQNHVSAFGNQIGVGKESDVYIGLQTDESEVCLKLHRLGRTSFKQVKNKRDYLRHRKNTSWLYMSRLSAETEIIIMKALFDAGYPVPRPVAHNRHVVIMEYIADAAPLYQVKELNDPLSVYKQTISILKRLLECGLVHGDFNEFNLLIASATENDVEKEIVRVIDFPQMVSRNHPNAKQLYNRDAKCIYSFFQKRFDVLSTSENDVPAIASFEDVPRVDDLDVRLKLSGYQCDPDQMESEEECSDDEKGEDEGSEEEGEEEEEEEGSEEEEEEEKEDDGAEAVFSDLKTLNVGSAEPQASSAIKSSIGRRRKGNRRRRTEPMSAEEVRMKVKRDVDREKRKTSGKLVKKEIRADRNANAARRVKEELDFGGDF